MQTRYIGKFKKSGFFGFVYRKDGIHELHYQIGDVVKLTPGVNPINGRKNNQHNEEWYVPSLFELGYFFGGVCNESYPPVKTSYMTSKEFFPQGPVVNPSAVDHHVFYVTSSTPQISTFAVESATAFIIQYNKLFIHQVQNPNKYLKNLVLFSTKKVEL